MAPTTIPWTDDAEANALLAADPNALLIGFVLDQQVQVQKAFSGPLELERRLGALDAGRIAAMDPAALEQALQLGRRVHLDRLPAHQPAQP